MATERFPRSLIASDTRVLLGYGKHTVQKQPRYLRVGECDVHVSRRDVSTLAVFELANEAMPMRREIYVASLLSTGNRVQDIKTLETFEGEEFAAQQQVNRRQRRAPEPDYRLRILGFGGSFNALPARSAPNGTTSEALMVALRPLSKPLVCSLRVFVMDDGSPLLTLIDDQLDRMVLAIGNVGDRIEWSPKARAGYKPPWFEQTLGGFETVEVA